MCGLGGVCVRVVYVWRNCAPALLFCIAASSGRDRDRWLVHDRLRTGMCACGGVCVCVVCV